MIKTITLTKSDNLKSINLSENPYIKIISVEVFENDVVFNDEKYKYNLIVELNNSKSSIKQTSYSMNFGSDFDFEMQNEEPKSYTAKLNISNSNNDFTKNKAIIRLEYSEGDINKEKLGFKVILHFENIELINIENPWKNFQLHLDENANTKILFSAPFGQGKTTFIKEFFSLNKYKYEVFHLFPVNYSVAKNVDIFQYIKVELLLQLIEKQADFECEQFSKWLTGFEFVKAHFDEILLPFARLIPKVGGNVHDVLVDLNKLRKRFIEFDDKAQIDDKEKAEYFIKQYYEKEGSVFEDNFYTQLIRQLVQQLKQPKIETVLIIDDLDRMDPEHIFRILNVFAAHFDVGDLGASNKFGFDKIIIVCDYSNLRHIFKHKYGSHTDFKGYIDKFSSRSIFNFNNADVITTLLGEIKIDKRSNNSIAKETQFHTILSDLIRTDNLSLREILKLQREDLSLINTRRHIKPIKKSKVSQSGDFYESNSMYNIPVFLYLHFLAKLTDIDTLIDKFEDCREKVSKLDVYNESMYNNFSLDNLIGLRFNENAAEGIHVYEINNAIRVEFSYSLGELSNGYDNKYVLDKKSIKYYDKFENGLSKPIKYNFSTKDYYSMLIDITKKYKEVGGLTGFER